jgi:hypothetical protein
VKREADFPKPVTDALAKRVGCRCSNPSCRKLTTGPRLDSAAIVCIGVGAHIHAASPGGSRFDPAMTVEERSSASNGIWLCQNCAKLVDNDEERYPADQLREWKRRVEAEALAEVEGRGLGATGGVEDAAELQLIDKTTSRESERHDYILRVLVRNLGNEQLRRFHVDLEMPTAYLERATQNPHYVPSRSSRSSAFFRRVGEELYPGDSVELLAIPYYVDHAIFWSRGGVFPEIVRATLYRPSLRPMNLERAFQGLQNF